MPEKSNALSRFDVIVWLVLLALVGAVALVWWRGDQVGIQPLTVTPADGAVQVSTLSGISATFSEELAGPADAFALVPPVTGTLTLDGRLLSFQPAVPLATGTEYTATISSALRSTSGRPLLAPVDWSFRTAEPRVLYAAGAEQEGLQLYIAPVAGGTSTQLTVEPYGIWDFALSPDGSRIVYAASPDNDEHDLWLIDTDGGGRRKLLSCPAGVDCTAAVWTPDGKRILYERRNEVMGSSILVPSRLWWVDPGSGDTIPVFQDEQRVAHSGRLAADGRWLSYISPLEEGMQVYDFQSGDLRTIPGEMQGPAAWAPAAPTFAAAKGRFVGSGYGASLLTVDMTTGTYLDVTGDAGDIDSAPVWAPDGRSLVFRRSSPSAPSGQLWIMNVASGEPRPLTGDAQFGSASPSWSPDGRFIVYQRFSLDEPYAEPQVWVLDIATGDNRKLLAPGAWPVWVP